jgi:peptidoglycan/LPS O-acetylase OafA/YrhL
MTRKRYESLDGMRGICAIIVAIFHFDTALHNGHLINHGWLSVDVFFVLSGFVISSAYEEKLRAGLPFVQFLFARARRLIPTQWLGNIVAAISVLILYLHGDMAHVRAFTPTAFLIATIFGLFLIPISFSPVADVFAHLRAEFPINPPTWSLQGEWFINLIYAWFLYPLRARVQFLLYSLAAIYLVVQIFDPMNWDTSQAGLARATVGFIAGVLIFKAYRTEAFQRLPTIRSEIIYAAWFLICSIPYNHSRPIFESVAILILAPLLVALLVRHDQPAPRLILSLGAISYPLYASHWAIVNITLLWLDPARERHSWLLLFPMLAASLALAWAIDRVTLGLPKMRPIIA